jgi:hypothetical protein
MVIEVPPAPGTPKMKVGVVLLKVPAVGAPKGLLLAALAETKAVLL